MYIEGECIAIGISGVPGQGHLPADRVGNSADGNVADLRRIRADGVLTIDRAAGLVQDLHGGDARH